MDHLTENFLRGIVCHIFDAHPTFRGGDDNWRAGISIHENSEVVFVSDIDCFCNHHLADEAACIARLHGDEGLIKHFPSEFCCLLRAIDEMNTTLKAILEMTFPAATCMDLRFDDELGTGEFLRGGRSLFGSPRHFPLGAWDLETVKQLLGLVFVNVHKI